MKVLTKTFNFVSNAEGWAFTTGDTNARTTSRWKSPSGIGHSTTIPPNYGGYSGLGVDLSTLGGSLSCSANKGAVSAENYWEYSGTWESLGVPTSSSIVAVSASYIYRWTMKNIRGGTGANSDNTSHAEFTASEAGSGPFELRRSTGELVGTFSTRAYAPARTALDQWTAYPLGTNQFPISATPDAFIVKTGSAINIPTELRPSTTSVILRLKNLMPSMPDVPKHFLKLRQDRITVEITYGPLRKIVGHGITNN